MNKSQFFNFEETDDDFPFYTENNFIFTKKGVSLLLPVIVFILLVFSPIRFQSFQSQLIFFLITILPLLYVNNGNLNDYFKKIKYDDIPLIISCFLGYELLYRILILIFTMTHFSTSGAVTTIDALNIGLLANILQVIGEELFKMILFTILLHLFYKFTDNRKISIIISVIIICFVFGLLHLNTFNFNIIQVLLIQGFGTIFEIFPYIKTKNITLSIIIHLLINISSNLNMFMF